MQFYPSHWEWPLDLENLVVISMLVYISFYLYCAIYTNTHHISFSEWAECAPPCIERRACEHRNRITQTRSQCRRCNKGIYPQFNTIKVNTRKIQNHITSVCVIQFFSFYVVGNLLIASKV